MGRSSHQSSVSLSFALVRILGFGARILVEILGHASPFSKDSFGIPRMGRNSAQGLVPLDRRKRLQAFATGADFNWLISNGMTSGIHSN